MKKRLRANKLSEESKRKKEVRKKRRKKLFNLLDCDAFDCDNDGRGNGFRFGAGDD